MYKNKLFTGLGVLLSFSIAFCGWQITKELIKQKESVLLSKEKTVNVGASNTTKEHIGGNQEEIIDESEGKAYLNSVELSEVVENLENSENEKLHEPLEGQLDMEQAIDLGKAWLDGFGEKKASLNKLLKNQYDKTNAYLCTGQSVSNTECYEKPYLSYWKIIFSNKNVKVNLIINAVTGQVLNVSIYSYLPNLNFDNAISEPILDEFLSGFHIKKYGKFNLNKYKAYKGFGNDGLYAVIVKSDIQINNEKPYSILNISLSSNEPINN